MRQAIKDAAFSCATRTKDLVSKVQRFHGVESFACSYQASYHLVYSVNQSMAVLGFTLRRSEQECTKMGHRCKIFGGSPYKLMENREKCLNFAA